MTAEYVQRAGLQAATKLLPMQEPVDVELATLVEFRDRLTQAAALCQTLTEVFDRWTFPTRECEPLAGPTRRQWWRNFVPNAWTVLFRLESLRPGSLLPVFSFTSCPLGQMTVAFAAT